MVEPDAGLAWVVPGELGGGDDAGQAFGTLTGGVGEAALGALPGGGGNEGIAEDTGLLATRSEVRDDAEDGVAREAAGDGRVEIAEGTDVGGQTEDAGDGGGCGHGDGS